MGQAEDHEKVKKAMLKIIVCIVDNSISDKDCLEKIYDLSKDSLESKYYKIGTTTTTAGKQFATQLHYDGFGGLVGMELLT